MSSVARVKEYLKKYNVENKIKEFDVSCATVQLASEAIGCEPSRIAKSLTFNLNGSPIMVVTSGDCKIDNRKYKETFGAKARMLIREEVPKLIGHEVGGVCPFAINQSVTVYLDVSLKRFKTVYPSCGSSNSVIELSLDELEDFSKSKKWVDVCICVK